MRTPMGYGKIGLRQPNTRVVEYASWENIPVSVALFSKIRCSQRPGQRAGFALDFVQTPGSFPNIFRRIATPGPMAIATAGISSAVPAEISPDGAWVTRFSGNFAYLVNLRRMTPGGQQVVAGVSTREQVAHVEQATFRFDRDHWATHAPSLFEAARKRVLAWPSGDLGITEIDTSDINVGPETPLANRPALATILSRMHLIVDSRATDFTGMDCSGVHPMYAALQSLSVKERRRTLIAFGWKGRLSGVHLQIYPDSVFQVGFPTNSNRLDPLEMARLRTEFRMSELDNPATSVKQLYLRVHDHLARTGEALLGRAEFADAARRMAEPAPGLCVNIAYDDDNLITEALRVLDIAFDVTMRNKRLLPTLNERLIDFFQGLLERRPKLPYSLLERVSWMEFAPALLSELIHSNNNPAGGNFLANLERMRRVYPETFRRLTLKMDVPKILSPTTWEALCASHITQSNYRAIFPETHASNRQKRALSL